jgi:dihydroorotate dehydrogenase
VNWYERLIRPVLFRLSPDSAHDLAQFAFRHPLPWKVLASIRRRRDGEPPVELAGMTLDSPVGLAPGFDKNGDLVASLDTLGFGYLVVGSVTRHPRPGNPKPRMARYPDLASLGNNLGLPSRGLDDVVDTLAHLPRTRARTIVSVTGFTADELIEAAQRVEPHVDAVELGLVCPNTTESERMAELEIFTEVARAVAASRTKPVFVRIPPHHDDTEWERVRRLLDVSIELGLDGVGTNGRRRVTDPRLPTGHGSISGRATFPDALRIVRDIARHSEGKLAIRASGGVFTGQDAAAMLAAGATTVEIYSAFVYRGPGAPRLIRDELLVASATEIDGATRSQ